MANKKAVATITKVEPRLLDVKTASEYLGCTVWFIRTLVWEKKLAHVKLGNRLLFDKADLDRFVELQKTAARA